MFVQFSLNAVAVGKPQKDFATSFTIARCIIFPMHTGLEKSRADDQGVCPGYDDNEEAPISYFVIKGALENMGVIHQ
jgi:hypothetical protein